MLDHTHLLAHAQELATTADSEVKHRAAASRAYYAFFHTAREIAERLALPLPAADIKTSHEKLYAQLIGCETCHTPRMLDVRKIGYLGRASSREIRVHADYKMSEPFAPEKTAVLIQQAINADEIFHAIGPALQAG